MNPLPTAVGATIFAVGALEFYLAMPSLAKGSPSVGSLFIPSLGFVFLAALVILFYGLMEKRKKRENPRTSGRPKWGP